MRQRLKILLLTGLSLGIIFQASSQNGGDIQTALSKTWYAVKVGEPEGGEMRPTSRSEIFTFNTDGTMQIQSDGQTVDPQWEYLEDSKIIKSSFVYDGNEIVTELVIRDLNDHTLVLVSPQNAMEYSDSPPDPNAPKPRTAPIVVGSESTIDVDNWSGLHPFNYKITETSQGETESKEAIGVLILLKGNGKNILRLNEDGLNTDIEVGPAEEMDGEMQFELMSDDPEFAGKIIFREDNSMYFYRDEDMSKVEYIKK